MPVDYSVPKDDNTTLLQSWAALWNAKINAAAKLFPTAGTYVDTYTNLPAGAIGYNPTAKQFVQWNGTTWVVLEAGAWAMDVDKVDGLHANNAANNIPIIGTAALAASKALVTDANGKLATSATVTAAEIGYLAGVSSAIQTQIDGKEPSFTVLPTSKGGTGNGTPTINRVMVSDGTGKIGASATITTTILGYISSLSGDIATLLGAKAPLNSPALTGSPTAPTQIAGDNTTRLATTAFVAAESALNQKLTGKNAASGYAGLDANTRLDGVQGGVLPGVIAFHAKGAPPAGWIRADGAAVSRTTYARLYAEIGLVYGVGDGSTTFNVPDLRGEFLRGWDDSRGVDSGRGFGTAQSDEIASHDHKLGYSGAGTYHPIGAGVYALDASIGTGPTGGVETRPRNIALLACIKY